MLFEIINYSSRCPNQDIHAIFKRLALFLVIDTTIGKAETKARFRPKLQCIFVNLQGKFPGRCKHQRTRISSGLLRCVLEQLLIDNQ